MQTAVRPRTTQQTAGIAMQVVLLAALAPLVGLGPIGWLAGIGYIVGLCGLLTTAAHRAGVARLGPADLVTLARAVLVGGVTALAADGVSTGDSSAVALVALATVALVLDGVDGQVARRSGTSSALGARFDMEVDSFLVLVLSVHVALMLGPWVLAIGAMRYLFVAVSWVAPWLRAPLPPRYSTKAVAAAQGIVLVVATADLLPRVIAAVLVALSLGVLVWSFGRDVLRLWRDARDEPARRSGPPR